MNRIIKSCQIALLVPRFLWDVGAVSIFLFAVVLLYTYLL